MRRAFATALQLALSACTPSEGAPVSPVTPTPSAAPTAAGPTVTDADPAPSNTGEALELGFQAFLAGDGARAKQRFEAARSLAPAPYEPFEKADWSSTQASSSGRFALIETGRCTIANEQGSSHRHCGEILVDVQQRRILQYLPVRPHAALLRGSYFLGETLVTWKEPGVRALLELPQAREIDAVTAEPLALLSGQRALLALDSAFEIRDLDAHLTVATLAPQGTVALRASGLMTRLALRFVSSRWVIIGLPGELLGLDLTQGVKSFSFASDRVDFPVIVSGDANAVTLLDVCDWKQRVAPMPQAGCKPKAPCPMTPSCKAPRAVRIELNAGATTVLPRSGASLPSDPEMRWVGLPREATNLQYTLAGMFSIAGELVVPTGATSP